jgi:hypothetical protein
VFEHFKDLLTANNTEEVQQQVLEHIRIGCLSDPDPKVVCLYRKVRKDQDGLWIYACSRGTSDVEGLHSRLKKIFEASRMGPKFADSALAENRHRNNIDCAIRAYGYYNAGHYDSWLTESKQIHLSLSTDFSQVSRELHCNSTVFLFTKIGPAVQTLKTLQSNLEFANFTMMRLLHLARIQSLCQ